MKNNSNNSNVWDKALDVLLEGAADMALEQLDKELPEPMENIEFSAEHKEKINRLFRKQRSKLRRKKAVKYTRVASVGIVALILCAGVSIASVEAWRVKFLNFVYDSSKPNTDYSFGNEKVVGTTYSDENITLNYVPLGFEVEAYDANSQGLSIAFTKDEEYFLCSIESVDATSSIDTEDATVESITINGLEGLYISKTKRNATLWHDDEHVYTVIGTLSREETIRISENFKKN